MKISRIISAAVLCFAMNFAQSQESIAREWNEVLLEGIRNDFARPTVHARNLFHVSAAMYDAWAVFNQPADPYLLGKDVHGFSSSFDGFNIVAGTEQENLEKAISYAAYRLIEHRFANSPEVEATMMLADNLFAENGFDKTFDLTNYSLGSSAALGNYIAEQYIQYGLQDGSNEANDYVNEFYSSVNAALFPEEVALDSIMGNPTITDPNRWQPLEFSTFIDQSGEILESATPDFLSPEWGIVNPFSLKSEDATVYNRDGFDYWVYHDPGPPPYHDPDNDPVDTELYQWNFSMVAVWSGHLDANLSATVDISPASLGNFDFLNFPSDFSDYDQFYQYLEGGDASTGRNENPFTEMPYETQTVKLGDYGRILAEFWADGPDSETPPGHWFTILNYVNENLAEKKLNGQGEELDDLEWDIKTYFLLGGTMHDVAISAWGIKGYYDYIRPISAIRYMADLGQSSEPQGTNYHPGGLPLVPGYIEQITMSDPQDLRGSENENIGKIKVFAWRGPGSTEDPFIVDPETDVAGVDWILAEQWWPYQRPTFITPPFAGYVSGHSTYSRAAAELLTLITGSPYFPNGLGEFEAPMNEFLVFEDGPSTDITLQWATYRDASDQCSLSRIWGGIHPPADDIPGRVIGEKIGKEAYDFGVAYFGANPLSTNNDLVIGKVYPNPVTSHITISLPEISTHYTVEVHDFSGRKVEQWVVEGGISEKNISELPAGQYMMTINGHQWESSHFIIKD